LTEPRHNELHSRIDPAGRSIKLTRSAVATYLIVVGAVFLEIIPIYLDGLRINQIVFMVLAWLGIWLQRARLERNYRAFLQPPYVLLMLYCFWCAISAMWSHVGLESFVQSLPLLIMLLGLIALTNLPVRQTVDAIIIVSLIIAVLSWGIGLMVPSVGASIGPGWRLNGIMAHPQRMVLLMAVAGMLLVSVILSDDRLFKRRFFDYAALAVFFVTASATQTRAFSSYAAISMGFLVFTRSKPGAKTFAILIALMFALVLYLDYDSVLELYARDGTNNNTLSGRTTIWTKTLALAANHVWIGHGFSAFFSDLTRNFFASYIPPHAHNDALNIVFETGVIGLLLMAAFLLSCLWYFIRGHLPYSGHLVLFALFCGTTGVIFGGKLSTPMVLILLLSSQELLRQVRKPSSKLRMRKRPR
jgi:O-antigen ligase